LEGAIFNPGIYIIVNVRVCTEGQLSQKEKIENIQEKCNNNFWNTPENV
jgi:hypothetical protein